MKLLRNILILFLFSIGLNAQVRIECIQNELVSNYLNDTGEQILFNGLKITEGNRVWYMHNPVVTNKNTLVTIQDAYKKNYQTVVSRINTHNTIDKLYNYLIDCNNSGGGGIELDTSSFKTIGGQIILGTGDIQVGRFGIEDNNDTLVDRSYINVDGEFTESYIDTDDTDNGHIFIEKKYNRFDIDVVNDIEGTNVAFRKGFTEIFNYDYNTTLRAGIRAGGMEGSKDLTLAGEKIMLQNGEYDFYKNKIINLDNLLLLGMDTTTATLKSLDIDLLNDQLVWRGIFSADSTYYKNDIVNYQGTIYYIKVGFAPGSTTPTNATVASVWVYSGTITRTGSGAPSNGLGVENDLYINTTTSDLYKRSGGVYSVVGSLRGIAGTVWRVLPGAPSNGLGVDGDLYLNTINGDVYVKISGSYTLADNLTGPTGATGSTGANGSTGAAGTPGATIRSGSGAPLNGTGIDGDYYLRTSNSDFYQKSGGRYYVIDNFTGATGATGSAGATGATGQGVPIGGTTGQVLTKIDGTDYNTQWSAPSGGGGSSLFSNSLTSSTAGSATPIAAWTRTVKASKKYRIKIFGAVSTSNTVSRPNVITTHPSGFYSGNLEHIFNNSGYIGSLLQSSTSTGDTFENGYNLAFTATVYPFEFNMIYECVTTGSITFALRGSGLAALCTFSAGTTFTIEEF